MDPVSAAHVLSTVLKVLQNLYTYYNAVRDAPARAAELRTQVRLLVEILAGVQEIWEQDTNKFQTTLPDCLADLYRVLVQLYERSLPRETWGTRRFLWPFTEKQNSEYIVKIQQHRGTLVLYLSLNQSQKLNELSRDIRRIKSQTTGLRQQNLIAEGNQILEWLCPRFVDPLQDQLSLQEVLVPGTATWVFQRKEYELWKSTGNSFLWVYGKLGAGKTQLTFRRSIICANCLRSSIVKRLREDEQAKSETRVLPFYCDFNVPEKRNCRYIIGNLLRQLAPSPSLDPEDPRWKHLRELYHSNQERKDLMAPLLSSLTLFSKFFDKVFIIVDGLDECLSSVDVCSALLRCLRQSSINVMAVSRREREIEISFTSKQEARVLEIQDTSVETDIGVYIDWRLNHDGDLKNIKKNLKQDIKAKLVKTSDGIFRWVQCQLDYLATLDRDVARRTAMETLAPGLPETYNRALNKLSSGARDRYNIAKKALTWLLYSERPLTLPEVALASVIDLQTGYDEEYELDDPQRLLDYCGSLLKYNASTKVVEISHVSVSQFLNSRQLPGGSVNGHYLDEDRGHLLILRSCLAWLSSSYFNKRSGDLFNDINSRFGNDFSNYAMYEWPVHAAKVDGTPEGSQSIIAFLTSPEANGLLGWVQLWETYESCSQNKRWWQNEAHRRMFQSGLAQWNQKQPPSALYYASLFGLKSSVQSLLIEDGAQAIQTGGFHSSPLSAARRNGHKDIVDMLLTATSTVNTTLPRINTATRGTSKGTQPLLIQPIKGLRTVGTLIDVGANLTKRHFERGEIPAILSRASHAGLSHIIIIGTTYASSRDALEVCEQFDGLENVALRCTIGIHPRGAIATLEGDFAKRYDRELEKLILSEAGRKFCVAVGECGLDYASKPLNELHQKQIFRKQLEMARKHDLPVLVYTRGSHQDFFGILKPYLTWIKALVHGYADSSSKNLRELVQKGVYIGLTGIVCDDREEQFNKNLVPAIPLDKLMIETDSPYRFPRNIPGHWGNSCNEPCLLPFIIRKITRLRQDCSEKELALNTTEVAKEFFKL